MKYSNPQLVFQEVPSEVSLALSISGCTRKCIGCHSQETWDKNYGTELTKNELNKLLDRYRYITCVLFYGGEWEPNIKSYFSQIRKIGFKVALYTGENKIPKNLIEYLDYIKIGSWIKHLGGLDSPYTNQKFYKKIDNNKLTDITYCFKSRSKIA